MSRPYAHISQAELENKAAMARAETDLELAVMTGQISPEFEAKLRLVLERAAQLNMMG